MSKPTRGRGRPKADPAEVVTARHVVNLTPDVDERVKAYARSEGIARVTDAIRMLVNKGLKTVGEK